MENTPNPASNPSSVQEHFIHEKAAISERLQTFFKHHLPSYAQASPQEQALIIQETINHMALLIDQKGDKPFSCIFIDGALAAIKLEFTEIPSYFKGVRQSLRPAFRPFLIRHDRSSIMLLEQIIEELIDAQNIHLIDRMEQQQQQQKQLNESVSQHQLETQLFTALAERTPDAIAFTDAQGAITYTNPSFRQTIAREGSVVGHSIREFIKNESDFDQVFEAIAKEGTWSGLIEFKRTTGDIFVGHLTVFAIRDENGNLIAVPGIMRDISKELNQEQEHSRLQQELIETQQMMLRELSTPIIPLTDSTLVMPLVGRIDNNRAQQVMESLLEGVVQHAAEVVILDITGVPYIDADIADILMRIARAVGLLGARMMLTGIRAEVAQTLVAFDLELHAIETQATLQSGIRHALQSSNTTNNPFSLI